MSDGIPLSPQLTHNIECFPESATALFLQIRRMMHAIAAEHGLGEVVESIKWGQPSFVVKTGTPVRFGWTDSRPSVLSVFVHCNTRLIDTFREMYSDGFEYVGNRELRLPLDQPRLPVQMPCFIACAMTYHKIKHLPNLGL